ncbi:hypothetical protein LHJ74_23165 [Streptomyces sp. N2-109]|uniref:CBM6 domain-containing protein n=1 Tax=Streptomyces gossypii TaxID=2883101 RepID=A0ABT2JY00_9ACTN|nr:hypothetical protein [Streptomyces gossypii]MCT2592777.1 hypothetical protein [Streptomyces gossypii]
MTAENNGTGTPEGDDPFAYLYRQEGGGSDGAAAQQPTHQPGVPRRSYNQVQAVGERQYGGAQQQYQGQPHQQQYQQQPGAQHPNAHYAAPETMPGGRAAMRQPGGGRGGAPGGGRGRGGGNRNGLLIGAVAVVAAVVMGIGAAMIFNDGGDAAEGAEAGESASAPPADDAGGDKGEKKGKKDTGEDKNADSKPGTPPKEDAATLRLEGDAHLEDTVPGAKGKGGNYVAGMNKPGSAARWDAQLDEGGTYNLYVRYSVPGEDMNLSLAVNGKPHATGLSMKNYAKAPKGDWEKGWTYTYSTVQIKKGSNTFAISCGQGDSCNVNLDQVWLKRAGG